MAGEHLDGFDPSQLTEEDVAQLRMLSDQQRIGSPVAPTVFTTIEGSKFRDPDPENIGILSALGLSAVVAAATGGMSVPTQIGAQMLGGVAASTLNSSIQGDIQEKGWRDVLTDARNEGFLWGGVQGAASGLGVVGRAARNSPVGQLVENKIAGPVSAFVRERLDGLTRSGGTAASASRLIRERLGVPAQVAPLPGPKFGLNGRYSGVLEDNAEAGLDFANSQGTTLPLGNVVRSKFVDLAQNIATGALTGSRIERLSFGNERVTQKYIRNLINKYPRLSPQDTGRFVTSLTREGNTFRGAVAEGHYQIVDDALAAKYGVPRDVRVPAGERLGETGLTLESRGLPLRQDRRQYATSDYRAGNPEYPVQPPIITRNGVDLSGVAADARKVVEEYTKIGVAVPGEIKSLAAMTDTVIPWAEAQRRRSAMFSLSQQFERGSTEISPVLKGRATLLSGNLTQAMENAASKAPREVRDSLTTANRIWREEMRGSYEKDFAVKLADEQPFEVMRALLNTKDPNDVMAMRALVAKGVAGRAAEAGAVSTQALQDKAFEKVQGSFLGHLIDQTSEEIILPGGAVAKYRKVDPTKLLDLIDTVGKDSKGELFRAWGVEDQIKNLRNVANFGTLNAAGAGGGHAGSIFFQMAQAGVLGGGLSLAVGGDPSEALTTGVFAFGLTPIAINRLFSDPALVKWLTVGAAAAPRSRLSSKVVLMVLGKMAQRGLLQERDAQRAQHQIAGAQRQLGLPTTGSFSGESRLTAEEQAQMDEFNVTDYGQIMEDRAMGKDTGAIDARREAESKLEAKKQQFMEMLGQGGQGQ